MLKRREWAENLCARREKLFQNYGLFFDSADREFFNVPTDSLEMHIRWQRLAAVFAVGKPGHMDGTATSSFQFFDQTVAAAFKAFLNLDGPISLSEKHGSSS
jgi:putative heme iron utilization protein